MLDDSKYSIAMAEVLHYLKGIRQEDIDKIPKNVINFFKENALKDYECNFDYYKPLDELELQEETKGILVAICLKYWCKTDEQKQNIIKQLNKNEEIYQEKLRKKYDIEKIFKTRNSCNETNDYKTLALIEYKKNIFERFLDKIKKILKK